MRHVIAVGILLCGVGSYAPSVWAMTPQSDAARSESSSMPPEARVELNSADQAALETLPGVGPRTAELIIEYRRQHGGFEKIEQLMNVRGIGERTFLRLRDLVTVSKPKR